VSLFELIYGRRQRFLHVHLTGGLQNPRH
jgi:hypothetical protein